MFGNESKQWQLLLSPNKQFFIFVSLINEKYQFWNKYRPLKTQNCQKVCITDPGLSIQTHLGTLRDPISTFNWLQNLVN